MDYNFDEPIDREGTNCYKYDFRSNIFGKADVIPMWVADMDFRTPDFVTDAIQAWLSKGILGYTLHSESLYQAVINWIDRFHQWKVNREWIAFTPGVVPAFNLAVLAFTDPGDKIIIQPPVYHPFHYAIQDHGRILVSNSLLLENGRYRMDIDNLKKQIDKHTKMLILCSPHNPTGNVWTKDELIELSQVCQENNVLIISDEIHADIVYSGSKHTPLASISDEIANNVVTLMAASKTFNFAGLSTSYFITSNKKHFDKLKLQVDKLHIGMGNIFGNVATEAAYRDGDEWLSQLIVYLKKNISLAKDFINNHIPALKIINPEATFLVWIDFRETNLSDKEIKNTLIQKAGVGLSEGTIFGIEGSGFQRINIGCPQSILEQSLIKIGKAFNLK